MYAVTGVSLYAGLMHGLIAARRPLDRVHLLFCLMCFAVAWYVCSKAAAYGATSVPELVAMRRLEIGGAVVAMAILPWFVAQYTGVQYRWVLIALTTPLAASFLANIVLPLGAAYSQWPTLDVMELPWGETLVDLRFRKRTVWYHMTWSGVFLSLGYAAYAAWRQFRFGARRRTLWLGLGLSGFSATLLFNVAVNFALIDFVHIAEFGFLFLVLVMNLALIEELRQVEHDLRDMARQVWHADRVVRTGAIAASLAHELNQPLTAILSNAQAGLRFLAREDPDLREIRDILEDVVRDDKRAAAVVNSLRTMVRRQHGAREQVDLTQAIAGTLELLHSELLASRIECEIDLESGWTVHADRPQIQQVILNLVMNAIAAMRDVEEPRRELRVCLAGAAQDRARVMVRDGGTGVSDERMPGLFQAFDTTKPDGLGLGLAICRTIVEAHGGRIWMVNNDDGPGASFCFDLPASHARAADGAGMSTAAAHPP